MYAQPYANTHIVSQPQLQSCAVLPSSLPQDLSMSHTQPKLFQDGSAPVFRACASAMQRPTLTNVRIRSTRDANQIFYAVLRNLLPMTVRRLDAEERRAITSGNVYVWEERGASSEATGLGIERWTDGMRWSPSRVRDEFLFYHQKELDPEEAADLPPTRWARIVRPKTSGADGSSSDASPDTIPHQRAPSDPEKLIKQTYSVLVALPEDRQRGVMRKWHLTAYFTQSTVDRLQIVEEVLPKPHVMVPEGLFRSARAGKIRGRDTATGRLQHQQQRQINYFDPDPLESSGVTPTPYLPSAHMPSSSTYNAHAVSYNRMTPHPYPYSHPHPQYSAYVQDNVNALPPAGLPPPSLSPSGGPYPFAPAFHPPPPPPLLRQRSVDGQDRGTGIAYTRPPRDWNGQRERETELIEQSRYDRSSERERVSPQRLPPALPNTYDPTPGHSPIAPTQVRSPSYAHPYAKSHVIRTTDAITGGPDAAAPQTMPTTSEYYSPAKPIKPIDVTPSRLRTQSVASPVSTGLPSAREATDASKGGLDGNSEVEFNTQREPAIGPMRAPSSPSPGHKSLHLPSARLSASPRSFPGSTLSEPTARLRSASVSGPSSADEGVTKLSPTTPNRNVEERVRSLVPLQNLENAVFPRRDPSDDALLRRFNALRTTAPAGSAREE